MQNLKDKTLIGIDVGVNTALTFMCNKKLLKHELIKVPPKTPSEDAIVIVVNAFTDILENTNIDEIFIEGVGLWGASVRSNISANKGDLFTVAYLVGALVATAAEYLNKGCIHIIQPINWKGNMSKKICKNRVNFWLANNKLKTLKNEHVIDSLGICLAQYGEL